MTPRGSIRIKVAVVDGRDYGGFTVEGSVRWDGETGAIHVSP